MSQNVVFKKKQYRKRDDCNAIYVFNLTNTQNDTPDASNGRISIFFFHEHA